MNAELQRYETELAMIAKEAHRIVAECPEEALNWRPHPGKWSVGECFDHLSVVGREFFPKVEEAMKKGRSSGRLSPGPFRHGFMGNMMVRSLEPPVKITTRSKTTPFFTPRPTHSKDKLLKEFDDVHAELLRLIHDADGLDLKRIKVQSMVVSWLKLSLGQWFAFILAHDRRHLWQARQVMNAEGFPA